MDFLWYCPRCKTPHETEDDRECPDCRWENPYPEVRKVDG